MADDQCDLDELAAFLDEDSNEAKPEDESAKNRGSNKGEASADIQDEMDEEALAALLDDESNESEMLCATVPPGLGKTGTEVSKVNGELDPDAIAAFLEESDSEDEFNNHPKETAGKMKTSVPITQKVDTRHPEPVPPTGSTDALQAELAAMQRRMLELQQLLSQSPSQKQQTSQLCTTQPQSRLLDESKDQNPFFTSPTRHKEKKSLSHTQLKQKSPVQSMSKPSYLEQADREALKREMFGDSDSDMEDLDGEKPSLSEHGKEIKGLLNAGPKQRVAHAPKASPEAVKKPNIDWKSKSLVTRESLLRSSLPSSSISTKKTNNTPEEKFIVDPFTGIRIVKPLVSSAELELKMKDRKIIKLSRLHLKVNTPDLLGDWVTIGVVVQKTEPKQSSSGKTFCIWKLADLDNCDQVVSFFLFGQTYKEHWKNDAGTVIGLLNPSIMDNADKVNKEVAFTINNPKQLLHMGRSKDLGWCTARTKKGNVCNHFINKKYGDFCSYHVQSAYKKTSSTRTELQGSVTGLTPKNYQKKMLPKKNSHFIYGGQTFSSLPNMKSGLPKQGGVTLKKLQVEQQLTKNKVTTMSLHELKSCDAAAMKKAPVSEKDQGFLDMISTPTVGSLNLVKHLIKKEDVETVTKEKSVMKSITPKELILQHKKDMIERRKLRAAKTGAPPPPPMDPLKAVPTLGKGLQNGDDIFLDFSPSRKPFSPSSNKNLELAKRKAVEKIQGKGGISKEDPNAVKKASNQEKVKKRVLENTEKSSEEDDESKEPPVKRSRLLGNVDVNSPEFQKMLKAKSSHKGALALADAEREEKYFTELEKKEMMEEKMQAITKLEVSIVTCRQCNYTAFSASETCKKENHNIVRHKGVKRFFKCKNCKHRTYSLDKYPKEACKDCGSSSFERTSMAREKTGPKLESETLCLRGDEQKFLNSMGGQVFMGIT